MLAILGYDGEKLKMNSVKIGVFENILNPFTPVAATVWLLMR